MRLTLLMISLAGLVVAGCASIQEPAPAPEASAQNSPLAGSQWEPLALREPILGVMVGMIDFSSWGVFRASTLNREPDDSEWLATGLASLNLIGASSLITLPGTGDHDAAWTKETSWRSYAADMQKASMAVSFAVRNRDSKALAVAANQLADACQSCHAKYRPELPEIAATRFASLSTSH